MVLRRVADLGIGDKAQVGTAIIPCQASGSRLRFVHADELRWYGTLLIGQYRGTGAGARGKQGASP